MTFEQYLQSIQSEDSYRWVIENMTSNTKFSKFKASAIIKKAFSEGYCPVDEFKVYRHPDELVFGQFIAIERAITSQAKAHDKLFQIATYILRPISDEVFDNEDTEKELINRDNILNHPVENVLRVINKYTENRNEYINVKYKGVFYKPNDDNDDDNSISQTVGNNSEDEWYWYSLIRALSKENIHLYGKTRMLRMTEVAPEVAFLRKEEKQREYDRKVEEIKRKSRNGNY